MKNFVVMRYGALLKAVIAGGALAGCGGGGGTNVPNIPQVPHVIPRVFSLVAASNGQSLTSLPGQPVPARVGTVIVSETTYSGSFTVSGGADGCVTVTQSAPPNTNAFMFAPSNASACSGVVEKFTFRDTEGYSTDLYLQV